MQHFEPLEVYVCVQYIYEHALYGLPFYSSLFHSIDVCLSYRLLYLADAPKLTYGALKRSFLSLLEFSGNLTNETNA